MMHWRRRVWILSDEAQSDSSKEFPQIFEPYRTMGRIRESMRDILDEMS